MKIDKTGFPKREIAKLKNDYSIISAIKRGDAKAVKLLDLICESKHQLDNAYSLSNEDSVIFYVLHESYDGKYAAQQLVEDMSVGQYQVDEIEVHSNNPFDWIKKESLINAAKTYGNWDSTLKIQESSMQFCITIFVGLLTLITSIFGLTPLKQYLSDMFNTIMIPLFVLTAIVFIVLVIYLIKHHYKQREMRYRELVDMVASFNDEEFEKFADFFGPADFEFSYASFNYRKECFLLRGFNKLSPPHQYLIGKYLDSIPKKQFWFIFSEYDETYEKFANQRRKDAERREYYLKPLTYNQKTEFAKELRYSANMLKNPGLKMLGLDYVVDYQMGKASADLIPMYKRVTDFSEQWRKENFQVNIITLIFFVADLYCTYLGDIPTKAWENLFRINRNQPTELDRIDNALSLKLFFQIEDESIFGQLPKLIVLILNNFAGYFEDILACSSLRREVIIDERYQQLILSKVVKCEAAMIEHRSISVSRQLYDIISTAISSNDPSWRDSFHSRDWVCIICSILDLCDRCEIYWHMPFIINSFIDIYYVSLPSLLADANIFSESSILKAATSCVLLNPDESYDSIIDHSIILSKAVQERKTISTSLQVSRTPNSFGLLGMTNSQRDEYYRNLVILNEQIVINYFNSMFDLFCISATNGNDSKKIQFLSADVANNDIFDKYIKKAQKLPLDISLFKKFTIIVIRELIQSINDCYPSNKSMQSICSSLIQCITNPETVQRTHHLLMITTRCDAYGSATLIFAAAILTLRLSSEGVVQSTYLGIGSSLLRMIFLMNFQVGLTNYFNDDVKYLVDILTSYKEPSSGIFGYLLSIQNVLKPKVINEQIKAFMEIYKINIINNLVQMSSCIKYRNIESFILEMFTLRNNIIDEIDFRKILSSIQQLINEQFIGTAISRIVRELISVFVDGVILEEVLNQGADITIDNWLASYSKDTVFLLYYKYIQLNAAQYLEKCPKVAQTLLNSCYVFKGLPILYYLTSSTISRCTEEYNSTKKLFCAHISNGDFQDIEVLNKYIKFVCQECSGSDNQVWVQDPEAIVEKLCSQKDSVLYIESQAYFRKRVLGHYGILMYLQFLIRSDLKPIYIAKEYQVMNDDEKTDYIITNFSLLKPTIEISPNCCHYDKVYIDALDAIINNTSEIQKRICVSEKQLLLRFANDTLYVLNLVFASESQISLQIREMLQSYIRILEN